MWQMRMPGRAPRRTADDCSVRRGAASTFPGVRRGARGARARWIALGLLAAVSLPAVTPRLYASDEVEYFAYLRSLWFDRDLSFDNEYRYFYDRGIARAHGFHRTFLELRTDTGLRINFGTIGAAILWSPFYALGDAAARAMRAAGAPVAVDGFSRPYLAAVTYGSAAYGFLAVCLSIVSARRLLGAGHLAGLAVWIGTPVLFYMYLGAGFAHACSAFAVALFVSLWLAVRDTWSLRGLAALGACAALMTMVREQDVFFVAGPAIDFAWSAAGASGRGDYARVRALLLRLAAGVAAAFVCYLPQIGAYLVLYGHVGPAPQVADKMVWLAPHALDVLLSPRHGLLVWTPLAVLSLAGLAWFAATGAGRGDPARARRIGLCLLAMFAAQVYVSGSVETWEATGSFGQRRFVGTTIILVIGLAAALRAAAGGVPRRAVLAAVAVCVWWNLGLMAQFGAGMMDRRRLEPARNARTTFLVLPRVLPALAHRYVFDRPSFYQDAERYREAAATR